MKSVMKHQFSQVPRADIPRSTFDRSHGHKTTFDAGYLVPFLVDEALPGDTFNVKATLFGRLSTPIFPIMDNMKMDTFFFFVPLRLLWDNFQKFQGEQIDPGDSTDYTVPQLDCPAFSILSQGLLDYMGLPTNAGATEVSAFHTRAYNLIWNEWFRDQNLQDSVTVDKDDGPDAIADYVLLKRGKRHDYFTSALPWPQKGPGVELPLGTSADVIPNNANNLIGLVDSSDGTTPVSGDIVSDAVTFTMAVGATDIMPTGLIADLSTATAATINSLRQAFQLQKLYERDARGGTRYTEIVKSHFGVTSPDARLQRPEYLGGSSDPVSISTVPQTSESGGTPQGNLAAFGTVTSQNTGFVKSFTEHGVIIGLLNVRADLTYQRGQNRMWNRLSRFDFYMPALAHLGEQTILNKEIYYQDTSADDDVFGYQERWAEYRYKPSLITGKLNSHSGSSLDAWHLSQEFSALPTLSAAFIEEDPPLDRCVAVPTEPHFILDSYISMKCARPMPVYSVPGLIDHF